MIYLAALSAGLLFVSNLAAAKLWDFFGIAVDGGIVMFPLTYVLGDLIVEFYGEKRARTVVVAGLVLNVLAILSLTVVRLLPAYPGWEGQEAFAETLGFVPRIVIGSLTAYAASQLLNNYVFEKIRARTGKKRVLVRFLGSSVWAHFVDSAIFETVAFLGVLSFGEFLAQAGFAYVAGIGLEVALSPVTLLVVKGLSKYLDE